MRTGKNAEAEGTAPERSAGPAAPPGKPFVNDIDNARFAGAEFGREGSAGLILARLLIFSC
jgi:hypothetical protein